jgi:hypothetical protein
MFEYFVSYPLNYLSTVHNVVNAFITLDFEVRTHGDVLKLEELLIE